MAQTERSKATPEQVQYANILFFGAWFGIALMFLTYFLYVFGIMTPHVPLELVVANWDKGVGDYMHITNSPHGWTWLTLLARGDFLNFLGIAMLALLTIVCYLVLLPGYLRRGDKLYATFIVAEVVVLSLAASGLLGSGGH